MVRQTRIISSVVLFFFLSLILTAYSVRNPEVGKLGVAVYQLFSSPVQGAVHNSSTFFSSVWDSYVWLVGARIENRTLKRELSLMKSEVARLRELSQEAEALRKILELREQTGYKGVVTSVIGADPSGWVRSVTVDRGSEDGIGQQMPAVLGGAVVGQVFSSAPDSSQVLLLTDRTSGVAALVQRSRARGIVLGNGSDDCIMEYVREEEDVVVGDTIVTSGFDGIYPKGLEIGLVTKVKDRKGGMFKEIQVRPTADLTHLETLFILTEYE
ncbi:MAG: rod shape-determining protein MreC [Bdellovibrionales bacterium]|nr:rod shape-determining protein MreC [Bdellovibrionales bacterium]